MKGASRRDFAPTYLNLVVFDAFGQRGFGAMENYGTLVPTAQGGGISSGGAAFNYVRNSNSVGYLLPTMLGGFYGTVQYAFGERNSSTPSSATNSGKQGNYFGGRLGYANGPLDVSGSYGRCCITPRPSPFQPTILIG